MTTDITDADDDYTEEDEAPKADPREQAKLIAQELLGMSQRQQAPAPQTQRERKLQQRVEGLVAAGHSKEAIKVVLDLVAAFTEDQEHDRAAAYQEQATEILRVKCEEKAAEALEVFRDKLPKFNTVKPGLLKDIENIIAEKPEFAAARELLAKGKDPSAAHFQKAANIAFDEFVGETGIAKRNAPISVRNSKARAEADNFDPDSLDKDVKRMYVAFKNKTGDEKGAREAVREFMQSRSGR